MPGTTIIGEPTGGLIFRDIQRLTSFTEDVEAMGLKPGSRLVDSRIVSTAWVAKLLNVPRLRRLRRVRTADGVPVCIETTYVPDDPALNVSRDELAGSLYKSLERRGKSPAASSEIIRVRLPAAWERRLLNLPSDTPVIVIRRRARTAAGQAIEVSVNVLRADRYAFRLGLRREPKSQPEPPVSALS